MKVNLFFRKPVSGFRSIEELFAIVQNAMTMAGGQRLEVPNKEITWNNIWENLAFAKRNKGQVNHITGDVHYLAFATGRNTVLTIHDAYSVISGSLLKKVMIKLFWFWLPALMVKRITTISEKSKKELEQIVPFAKRKIRVIPNPYNPKLLEENSLLHSSFDADTSKPIVLHLGTKSNKNLERTIEAMEGLPYKMYILGKLSDEQAILLAKHHIDFHAFFNLPYSEVARLYHRCTVVCFASLYEGFGMPIIEAQLVGKPVITSNVDPMPWVAGADGAHFVDPYSTKDIRNGIRRVVEDEGYRKQLAAKGSENVLRFEPQKIAKMYEDVYREVLG